MLLRHSNEGSNICFFTSRALMGRRVWWMAWKGGGGVGDESKEYRDLDLVRPR